MRFRTWVTSRSEWLFEVRVCNWRPARLFAHFYVSILLPVVSKTGEKQTFLDILEFGLALPVSRCLQKLIYSVFTDSGNDMGFELLLKDWQHFQPERSNFNKFVAGISRCKKYMWIFWTLPTTSNIFQPESYSCDKSVCKSCLHSIATF